MAIVIKKITKLFILLNFYVITLASKNIYANKTNILLLGDSTSDKSCYKENLFNKKNKLDKKEINLVNSKDYIRTGQNNTNSELYHLYSELHILNKFKIFPDFIIYFYSLKDENSSLEEGLKNIKLFFKHTELDNEFNISDNLLLIVNQRKRIVPAKEQFIKNLTNYHKINFIHHSEECEDGIDKEFMKVIRKWLKEKIMIKKKYNNTHLIIQKYTEADDYIFSEMKSKMADLSKLVDRDGQITLEFDMINILANYKMNGYSKINVDFQRFKKYYSLIFSFLFSIPLLLVFLNNRPKLKEKVELEVTPEDKVIRVYSIQKNEIEVPAEEEKEEENDNPEDNQIKLKEGNEINIERSQQVIGDIANEDIQVPSILDTHKTDQTMDSDFCLIGTRDRHPHESKIEIENN